MDLTQFQLDLFRVDVWFNFWIPEKNAAAFNEIHKIVRDMQIFSK